MNRGVPTLLAGASGYSFKEWKGSFYPQKIKPEEMLSYYAARLPTVEINSSFYALPKISVLEKWAASVPESFCFAMKAPKEITHIAQLRPECAEPVEALYRHRQVLGPKRGPVLFQLPPYLRCDLPRLQSLLALLPQDHRAASAGRACAMGLPEVAAGAVRAWGPGALDRARCGDWLAIGLRLLHA